MPQPGGSDEARAPILIFGTVFVDCKERQRLTEQWLTLTRALNPDADLLLVDSASPTPLVSPEFILPPRLTIFDFGDNIGHLSRAQTTQGRDGWGRAFCKGLDYAVEKGYRHVAHIEGDSLLRLPVAKLVEEMGDKGAGSIPVRGMAREIPGWIETGLMVFSAKFLKASGFTRIYDWPRRRTRPTPEVVVRSVIGEANLHLYRLVGLRGDKNQISHQMIAALNLDWVTHCHNDIFAYDEFIRINMPQDAKSAEAVSPPSSSSRVVSQNAPHLKINLGCGANKLDGWFNHDADIDIANPLPWAEGSASAILIEHCVEHVSYHQAVRFFEEAFRVLAPGGVLRVVVPSIEQIIRDGDQKYFNFTAKWTGEPTLNGALKAIIFAHGHQQAWTASLMRCTLRYAGFEAVDPREVGQSPHAELRGVEGHGKAIGDAFNAIESMVFEAMKPPLSLQDNGPRAAVMTEARAPVAVVVGGAECVWDDVQAADALIAEAGLSAAYFVVNDMIAAFDRRCAAVTLHPSQLSGWLDQRSADGFPDPDVIWTHRPPSPVEQWAKLATKLAMRATPDTTEHGSSGLFAVKIARESGFDRIILCGVPMTAEGKHIKRRVPWPAARFYRKAWETNKAAYAPFVRSMGGWTAEMFGRPSLAFLEASGKEKSS